VETEKRGFFSLCHYIKPAESEEFDEQLSNIKYILQNTGLISQAARILKDNMHLIETSNEVVSCSSHSD
jgi:hypothetical protein